MRQHRSLDLFFFSPPLFLSLRRALLAFGPVAADRLTRRPVRRIKKKNPKPKRAARHVSAYSACRGRGRSIDCTCRRWRYMEILKASRNKRAPAITRATPKPPPLQGGECVHRPILLTQVVGRFHTIVTRPMLGGNAPLIVSAHRHDCSLVCLRVVDSCWIRSRKA